MLSFLLIASTFTFEKNIFAPTFRQITIDNVSVQIYSVFQGLSTFNTQKNWQKNNMEPQETYRTYLQIVSASFENNQKTRSHVHFYISGFSKKSQISEKKLLQKAFLNAILSSSA